MSTMEIPPTLRPDLQFTLAQLIDGRDRAVRAGNLAAVVEIDYAIERLNRKESENTVAAGLPERRNQ
jgi:hypothetical protein